MTPLEAVGPDLLQRTNWKRRAYATGMESFGRADFTFGDVVSATQNRPFSTYGVSVSMWAYGLLVQDTRTPPEVLSRVIGPLTNAFIRTLKSTPLAEQDIRDLVTFMDCYGKARATGRFKGWDKRHISRLMFVLAANFAAKVNGRTTADYSKPKPRPIPDGHKADKYGYYNGNNGTYRGNSR